MTYRVAVIIGLALATGFTIGAAVIGTLTDRKSLDHRQQQR